MLHLLRICLVASALSAMASAGTITYQSRDLWQLAVTGYATEDFSAPVGLSPSVDFSLVAVTSDAKATTTTDTKVKHVNTSFLDLEPNPDGGNYIGTVGRTESSSTTITTTNTEWCKAGTCVEDTPVQTTTSLDYSDVRTLEIDFHQPTLNFGFDYIATLSGASPNRSNHAFRMVLTFIDGTTSSLWIGGNHAFASYQEGFMGVTSDLDIASVVLHAADRSVGTNSSITGGDWVYQTTKPKKGDLYAYSLSEITSSDQSSALLISNLTATIPEPAPATSLGLGGLLLGVGYFLRKRGRKSTN
jgi:hypothetical protein